MTKRGPVQGVLSIVLYYENVIFIVIFIYLFNSLRKKHRTKQYSVQPEPDSKARRQALTAAIRLYITVKYYKVKTHLNC